MRDWLTDYGRPLLASLIITLVLSLLMGAILGYFAYVYSQPCEYYANFTYRSLPARCISYFEGVE